MVPVVGVVDPPKPPRVVASVPVQPAVTEAAFTSAVVGDPPRVNVTFVSLALVRAAPVVVLNKVPVVGNVTVVVFVIVKVDAKAPDVVKFPPSVKVLVPLLTPVPPRAGESVPVHPAVIEAAFTSAVVGDPPRVNVTFVSLALVSAAPVVVLNRVPVVGNVTVVAPVIVNVEAKAPDVARLPARVKVFVPLFTPVPPRVGESVPVHPAVIEAALTSAVVGEPPKVNVTFVSFALVRAAPVVVLNSVPVVGNVTVVAPVIVNVEAKAPDVAKFPANVKVLVPLFTPVPPRAGESVPVHPAVIEAA